MNNLYLCSPEYVNPKYIKGQYIQDLTYKEIIDNEYEIDKNNSGNKILKKCCVSEYFDFLMAIERFNNLHGSIDRLVIASEMWPYGIKLMDGLFQDHCVTIESFYEYPHNFKIKNTVLIGVGAGKKVKNDRETFVESLLKFVQEKIIYYSEQFFRIDKERKIVGEYKTIERV